MLGKIYKITKCIHCGHSEEEEIGQISEIYGYDEADQLAKEYIDSYE